MIVLFAEKKPNRPSISGNKLLWKAKQHSFVIITKERRLKKNVIIVNKLEKLISTRLIIMSEKGTYAITARILIKIQKLNAKIKNAHSKLILKICLSKMRNSIVTTQVMFVIVAPFMKRNFSIFKMNLKKKFISQISCNLD